VVAAEAASGSPNSGAIRFGDSTGWKFHFGRSRESVGGALNSGTSGVLMTIQDNGNVGIGTTSPQTDGGLFYRLARRYLARPLPLSRPPAR